MLLGNISCSFVLFCFCFLCKTIKAFQKQQNVLDQNDLLLAEMSWCWIPVQLARQTACNPFCCDLGLDGTQTSPPPELWAQTDGEFEPW